MRQLLTSGTVCRVLGIKPRLLDRWIAAGLFTPYVAGLGKGGRHIFEVVDLLAIELAIDLRRRGFSLADASAALESLRGRDLAELQEQWASGRKLLVILESKPAPWLVAESDITEEMRSRFRSYGGSSIIIDVESAFAQLTDHMESLGVSVRKEREPA